MSNVLTLEEINSLRDYAGDIHPRDVESEVIRKLAAGVSVSGCDISYMDHSLGGKWFDGFSQEAFTTALAAARVAAIEECAKRMNDWRLHPMDARNLCDAEEAIRAMLGKEAQSCQ